MTGVARMVTSAERLRRLLALVPYVASRKAVSLAETAATFGMTERELIDDLNLAWCVELKDPDPYCPIDLSYEGGEIVISQAESIERPLRLAADEASALLVALRTLQGVGGGTSGGTGKGTGDAGEPPSPVESVILKLENAAAGVAVDRSRVAVVPPADEHGWAQLLRTALAEGRRVHLRHYGQGRDEVTDRDVDPMRLLVAEGHSYLEGWCRRAEGVRLFRLDRILDLSILDVAAQVPADAEPVDVDAGLFRPSAADVVVVLDVSAAARWVAEYFTPESVADLDGGWLRVTLRTPDTGRVRRFALRLGDDLRVVSPAALVTEVREAATAALALYDLHE